MTSKSDRCNTCCCVGYDRVRGNVALAKLAITLGIRIDATEPDHVILEQLATAAVQQRQEIIAQESERARRSRDTVGA